jgi:hypothetical protein
MRVGGAAALPIGRKLCADVTFELSSREFEPTARLIWNWGRQAERNGTSRKDRVMTRP